MTMFVVGTPQKTGKCYKATKHVECTFLITLKYQLILSDCTPTEVTLNMRRIPQSQISCKKHTVSLAHNFQCKTIWKNKLCLTIGDFNSASGQLSSLQSSCKKQVRKGQGKTKEQLKTPLTSIKRSPQKLFMIISPAKMWTSKLKHSDISSKKVSFDFPKFKHFITKKRVFSWNPSNAANDRILRISQLDIERTIKNRPKNDLDLETGHFHG